MALILEPVHLLICIYDCNVAIFSVYLMLSKLKHLQYGILFSVTVCV